MLNDIYIITDFTRFKLNESEFNIGADNAGPPLVNANALHTNGGSIGGEFETRGDVTAEPEPRGGYKYNVKDVKYAKDKRREKALKRLKKLNRISFSDWLAKNK